VYLTLTFQIYLTPSPSPRRERGGEHCDAGVRL